MRSKKHIIAVSETSDANSTTAVENSHRPEFRGCVICYSAEWAVYAGKKAYRTVSK